MTASFFMSHSAQRPPAWRSLLHEHAWALYDSVIKNELTYNAQRTSFCCRRGSCFMQSSWHDLLLHNVLLLDDRNEVLSDQDGIIQRSLGALGTISRGCPNDQLKLSMNNKLGFEQSWGTYFCVTISTNNQVQCSRQVFQCYHVYRWGKRVMSCKDDWYM